jgi:hypothetical protein
MARLKNARKTVLKANRAYYTHLGYYHNLLYERGRHAAEVTEHELDFLEFAFRTHATHRVKDVFDVACGSGRHVLGLVHRG